MLALALLVTGMAPMASSTVQAAIMTCEDGSPPPCTEPEPDPEPEPEPEPEDPPPPPEPDCDDAGGFARPAGLIPPGYIYNPTRFGGVVADPQPDDTFAADAPGHATHVGRFRTRVVNGQEQFLVCAHVGTNTPSNALTPFPFTGTGAHPATIMPRVIVIDAVGNMSGYFLGAPGTTGTVSHYQNSTSVHEGFVQMWVPLTPSLREPGFTVRVEIRGTASLPNNGILQVMGADEVFVHLGPAPQPSGGAVWQSLGMALDDGVVAERPSDPGIDDISSYFGPIAIPVIKKAVEAMAPQELEDGTLNSIEFFGWVGGGPTLDIVPFPVNPTVSELKVRIPGNIGIQATVEPRESGIVAGSCEVSAGINGVVEATFSINLTNDQTKPRLVVRSITASATVMSLTASGEVWAWWDPFPLSCHNAVEDGIKDAMQSRINAVIAELDQFHPQVGAIMARIHNELDAVANIQTGPLLSSLNAELADVGFSLMGATYAPTGPGALPSIKIWQEGLDLAANFVAWNPGSRFAYTAVPRSSITVAAGTHYRARWNGQSFDVGLILNGTTVNQILRALTAGKPQLNASGQMADKGILDIYTNVSGLDVAVHPSVPPLYLPALPAGWPATGNANLYVPSLRISLSTFPEIATVVTDVRVGIDAFLDGRRLVPYLQATQVVPRFLRLGPTINMTTDPLFTSGQILNLVFDRIRQDVPGRVATVLEAPDIPDLSASGGPSVYLRNLSVQTVGDGHLGVYVDVETTPDPGTSVLSVAWAGGGPGGAPTSVTLDVSPNAIPGMGPYSIVWTLKDANNGATLYQSPAGGENLMSKTLPASQFTYATDPCAGQRTVTVLYTLAITRGGYTKNIGSSRSFTYAGTPPAPPLPAECMPEPEPEPAPEPEPEPDPIPAICRTKPWLCEDY